ncbi:MAG: Crp/Fnr family transcriptional regulator, partial [bacterium]|nr:Crp/Fnr family transcriptional regulator [bacterium]
RSTDAAAETEVRLLVVKESDFHNMLENFPSVAIEMLRELALRIRNSDSQIKGLSILNARGKVASSLLRWANDQGEEEGRRLIIRGTSNQSGMASYVGLTRETYNRNLHHLQEEGFITIDKRNVVIINEYKEFKKIFGPFF